MIDFASPFNLTLFGKHSQTSACCGISHIFSETRVAKQCEYRPFAYETDLVEFAKTHLPILLGTQVKVLRSQMPRPVNRIH